MNDPELLKQAIDKAGLRMQTYEETKDWYQDRYGQKGWIGAYAKALQETGDFKQKNGQITSYRSIRRGIERVESKQQKTSVYTSDRSAQKVAPPSNPEVTVTIRGIQHRKWGRAKLTSNIKPTTRTIYVSDVNPSWHDFWVEYDLADEVAEDSEYGIEVTSVVAA